MKTMATAGQLRERVTVQRRSEVSDGAGNYLSDWANLYTSLPARIIPLRGGETVIASKLQGTGIVNIVVRYSSESAAVTTEDRIVHGSETYNIRYISNEDERDRFLTFMCERGVADG